MADDFLVPHCLKRLWCSAAAISNGWPYYFTAPVAPPQLNWPARVMQARSFSKCCTSVLCISQCVLLAVDYPRDQGTRCLSPTYKRPDHHGTNRGPSGPTIGPHSHANDAKCTDPMAQQAPMPRHTSCGEDRVTVQGPIRSTMQGDPRCTSRSRSRLLHARAPRPQKRRHTAPQPSRQR